MQTHAAEIAHTHAQLIHEQIEEAARYAVARMQDRQGYSERGTDHVSYFDQDGTLLSKVSWTTTIGDTGYTLSFTTYRRP